MKIRILPFAAALSAALALTASAELKVGDPAPKLQTGEWVQGEPIKEFDKDHVYVVEFWATWCGPCRATIPHLNNLHKELKDKGVVFIGQDCWEEDDSKVKDFVAHMGEKMTYRVAKDDKSKGGRGLMAANWMKAAGQGGIPAAFVVGKDGKLAWIGHPGGLNAEMLTSIAAGTFDSAKAAQEAAEVKTQEKTTRALADSITKAVKSKDWDTALAGLDAMEKADPKRAPSLLLDRLKFTVHKGDSAEVVEVAKKVAKSDFTKNPMAMNQAAQVILTELDQPSKEAIACGVELGEKGLAAANASKSTKPLEKALILYTLARGQFMKGDKAAAIKTQEEAIATAPDEDMKTGMGEALAAYKDNELPEVKPAPKK